MRTPFRSSHPRAQLLVLVLLMAMAGPTGAVETRVLKGHLPPVSFKPSSAVMIAGAWPMQLTLGLPLRNTQELGDLLRELYDPQSPLFRHFLSPDEFTARFGPTPEDYQAVIDFAKRSGLTVETTYPNRLMVDVRGKLRDVQRAFNVQINAYSHPEGGYFYAPDREPSVDVDVPLEHITGLNSFARRHSKFRKGPNEVTRFRKSGTGPSGLFQGKDFRDAYVPDVPSSLNGAGQTIALMEFDGYYLSDITYYESHSNPVFTAPDPVSILIDGFDGVVCGTSACQSDDDEVSLDIEMAMAIAPGAQIAVYEASPSEDYNTATDHILAKIAQPPLAAQISSSWGGYGDHTTVNLLNQLAAQGQAYFEASGDVGALSVSGSPNQVSDDPSLSLSPWETLVGGTGLTTSVPAGSPVSITYTSETTWTDSLGASSGGICNGLLAIPTYQVPVPMTTNGGSTSWRNLPDVSMTANNIYVVSENLGYLGNIEGTSAASPLWAGFMTLVNQQAASVNKGPMGNPNPALYRIALSPTPYAADMHDINDGSDSYWPNAPASGPYTAVAGYDLATGLGSPKGQALVNDLVGILPTWTFTPTPTFSPTPCGYPGNTCTFTPTPTATYTPVFLQSPLGKLEIGPNVVKGAQPVCLFMDRASTSSQWDVYDIAGERVAHLVFGSENECWGHANVASGLYLIRVQVKFVDGTSADQTFKVVLLE